MVNCLYRNGIEAYTAELCVRYLLPIPIGSQLEIQAQVQKSRRNLHWTEASISIESVPVATATAKFIDKD
jgi:hypothetical protein